MGQLLDKHRGGNQRAAIFRKWQNNKWELVLDREDSHEDTIRGMLEKKDQEIDLEAAKRIKLDETNKELVRENKVLMETINTLAESANRRSKSRKRWKTYSKKQQQRKQRELKTPVSNVLLNVDNHFETTSVTFRNKETSEILTFTYPHKGCESLSIADESAQSTKDMLLYVKENYGISDKAYHELSMLVTSMPRSCSLKKKQHELNSNFDVSPTPEGTLGVQQSFVFEAFCADPGSQMQ